MKMIIPHLWFDKEAGEAAKFYTSAFPNSRIIHSSILHNTPSGDVENLTFELNGQVFHAISAGPLFKFNPSISFFVNFDPSNSAKARVDLDKLWGLLAQNGKVLMPLQKYPFSEYYGWVEDRFGVSWQLTIADSARGDCPFIVPSLLFTKTNYGKAEEAMNYYLSVFKPSKKGMVAYYTKGQEPETEGNIAYEDFMLLDGWFAAMESSREHDFIFNEAISLMVNCKDQNEIDYYWKHLSAVPEAEQCGWLKDKYGVSWQIVPEVMNVMLSKGTPEQVDRVTKAFLKMKKFNIAELEKEFNG